LSYRSRSGSCNSTRDDTLDITVKEPKGVNTPWVHVVTCPHYVRGQVPLELQGVAGQPPIEVLASVYGVSHRAVPSRDRAVTGA
jgi:hypothetical protein